MGEVTGITPVTFREARASLRRIAALKDDWDSYQSTPPSPLALETATQLIGKLEALNLKPDSVEPTSDRSILVQCQDRNILWKWEIDSDGDVGVMRHEAGADADFFDLKAADIAGFPYGR